MPSIIQTQKKIRLTCTGLVAEVFRHISTNCVAKIIFSSNDLLSSDLVTDFVHNDGETSASSIGHGHSPDCLHTIVLLNSCLHDIARDGAVLGQPPTRKNNNMVSVLEDDWRNICSPQICSSIKPWQQTFRCGYGVQTCQKHLIE